MRVAMLSVAFLLCASLAQATDWIHWVDGTAAPAPARVNGVLNGQAVTFTSTGPILSPQTGAVGEHNYWLNNAATYTGGDSLNPPVTSDLVRLVGPGTHTLIFAQPVTGLVMAMLSFGGLTPITFDFGAQPFTILKTGPGAFGNRAPLTQSGTVLTGNESSGLIHFLGTISTLTWAMPIGENWTGFTIGLLPASGPPPSPPVLSNTLHAGLEWEYAAADEANLIDGGFRLYEGFNQACDQPDPLPLVLATIPPTARTYARMDISAQVERVCYELTAYNSVGESLTRSNRAVILVAELAPAAPVGVEVLVDAQ